jgi:hypothetical protein
LSSFAEWNRECEALRQIANNYKHTPGGRPDENLLKLLELDLDLNYAPIVESDAIRQCLALFLRMKKSAEYPAISKRLLERVDAFLTAVKGQPGLMKVHWGRVSFHPKDLEH